jgi:2-beta-glucuronyltransferase
MKSAVNSNVEAAERSCNYLVISAHHDYRTPRRASIHFITDELARRGKVRFFSMRYSLLSKSKGDIRNIIDTKANRLEMHDGVECFLWKSLIHPFNVKKNWLKPLEDLLFWQYSKSPNKTLVDWIKEADVIVYESGITPIYFELAKSLNPAAMHVYRANDDLATINVASFVHRKFLQIAKEMDAICLVSKSMAPQIPSAGNIFVVPHGLDDQIAFHDELSPFGPGVHAVALGSMLFDATFFEVASLAFAHVTFHVIGSGHPRASGYGPNVVMYDHMPYAETIRYIKHADIGIAPYISEDVPVYLADSSLKMLQYDFFGLPTVCPQSVTGSYSSRFGYRPGDPESIQIAIRAALVAPHISTRQILAWSEVVDRLLNPALYDDTKI